MKSDEYWLEQALFQAKIAASQQEVPIGAVLVKEDRVIGVGYNQSIALMDPSAHAEIIALRSGAQQMNNYRLLHTTLYVTLEPCCMCVGALIQARIQRLVFGAYDAKSGAVCSQLSLLDEAFLNYRTDYSGGCLMAPCKKLLTQFFQERRKSREKSF